MSKRQRTQSTVDPPTSEKSLNFSIRPRGENQRQGSRATVWLSETMCHADSGSSDVHVDFPDRELLSPAGDECSAEEAVTLVTSPTLSTFSQPSSSSSASGDISDVGDLLKTVATSKELELVVDALTDEEKHHILTQGGFRACGRIPLLR